MRNLRLREALQKVIRKKMEFVSQLAGQHHIPHLTWDTQKETVFFTKNTQTLKVYSVTQAIKSNIFVLKKKIGKEPDAWPAWLRKIWFFPQIPVEGSPTFSSVYGFYVQ